MQKPKIKLQIEFGRLYSFILFSFVYKKCTAVSGRNVNKRSAAPAK